MVGSFFNLFTIHRKYPSLEIKCLHCMCGDLGAPGFLTGFPRPPNICHNFLKCTTTLAYIPVGHFSLREGNSRGAVVVIYVKTHVLHVLFMLICAFYTESPKVRDNSQEPCGRLSFLREIKNAKGLPQTAVCNLNITLPALKKVRL